MPVEFRMIEPVLIKNNHPFSKTHNVCCAHMMNPNDSGHPLTFNLV